jgi:hypothetical protein
MPIDLENFIRAIVNDGVASRRAPIARDEHAALEFESQDRRRLGLWNVGARLRRTNGTYMTYGTYVPHAPKHPHEILSSAAGKFHHWPVRWR